MAARGYPRLFACDFLGEKEKSAQELIRAEFAQEKNNQRAQTETKEENERTAEDETTDDDQNKEDQPPKAKYLCIRVLCEHEENWHPAGSPFEIDESVLLQNNASYLSRIMTVLKHSDLNLEVLNTTEGEAKLQHINEVNYYAMCSFSQCFSFIQIAQTMNIEVKTAYAALRRYIMDCDPEDKYSGLTQCLMPSGKILWLCDEHRQQSRVVPVTQSMSGGYTRGQTEEKSEIVKALAKLYERSKT